MKNLSFIFVIALTSVLLLTCSQIVTQTDLYPDLEFDWTQNPSYELLIVNDTHERIHVELTISGGPTLCERDRKTTTSFFLKKSCSKMVTFDDDANFRGITIYAETLDWHNRRIHKGMDEQNFISGSSTYEIRISK